MHNFLRPTQDKKKRPLSKICSSSTSNLMTRGLESDWSLGYKTRKSSALLFSRPTAKRKWAYEGRNNRQQPCSDGPSVKAQDKATMPKYGLHGVGRLSTHSSYTGLFISPSGISELDCATTKIDTAERSISIGRESLQVFFLY